MSYELEAFKTGLVLGYILLWCIMAIISIIYYRHNERRFKKFLVETKQYQKYEEFVNKNTPKYKIIKQ